MSTIIARSNITTQTYATVVKTIIHTTVYSITNTGATVPPFEGLLDKIPLEAEDK